jgi:uncharacterized protein HemX
MSQWLLIVLTLAEVGLLALVAVFYFRLRRSESLISLLQQRHEDLMAKLHFNAELEQQLVSSFEERQQELAALNEEIERRVTDLQDLLDRAEKVAPKPDARRQAIMDGRRRGLSVKTLAQSMGLTVDEVELLLMDSKPR